MTLSRARTGLVLAAIVALGTYLRCYYLADRPIWFDEAFSYTLVERCSWREMVERTAADVHPPLYYAVLRCWTARFGMSPVAMRSLSVTLAAVTIAVFYLLCKDAFSGQRTGMVVDRAFSEEDKAGRPWKARMTGLIAALLISLSAAHIAWSYEARMYTLGTALLGVSTLAMLRALRSPRPGIWWTGYAASATAMMYTHNYALFSFTAQALFVAGWFCHQPAGWADALRDRRLWSSALAVGCAALAYLPWLPVLIEQKRRVQAEYWIPRVSAWSVPEAWLSLLLPVNRPRPGTHTEALAATVTLICLLAVFLWLGGSGKWLIAWMIVCPVALALLVSWSSVSIIVGRHFLLAYMFVLCAAARVVAALPRAWGTLALALLVGDSAAAIHRYRESVHLDSAAGIRGAMEYIEEHQRPGEAVVVAHPCIYFSARYYASDKSVVHLLLTRKPLHYTGGPILREDDYWNQLDLDGAAGERIWLVDTTGFEAFVHDPPFMTGRMRADQTKRFPTSLFFEGEIIVDCYERIAAVEEEAER